jgi:hypothetical protein
VIGFFVILSIWGLVNVLSNTFNLPKNQPAWPFGGSVNTNSNTNSSGSFPSSGNDNQFFDYTPPRVFDDQGVIIPGSSDV